MNARKNYEESLKISLEQDIHGLILQNLINIGNTFLKENSLEEALLHYGAAWTFSRSVGNQFGECQALDCMGQANQMNENLLQAEKNWIAALKIYRAMDPSLRDAAIYGEKQALERLAELYEEMGEHEQAEECHSEAQKLKSVESGDK
jgi:tetratricopeptide (TPR) repeat protein